ncbi:ATP-NAD kinase-like domain-containing protein [Syncephalastrum racemosum]|uniref:ATP-NAD kinase-like domain-containing protein n=1 Tax=Syncephalastrum racemosum TaxID=13706 RepID=A0A1X2H3F4_SYNRA|nr:ATP-NAD kinase-like domain-containing protein [Syncephalastrum racemosum]
MTMTTTALRVTNDHDQAVELRYNGEAITFAGEGAAAMPTRDRNCMIMLPNATKPSAVSPIDNHHVLHVSAKANTLFLNALCKREGKKRTGLQLVKLRYILSSEQSAEADRFCEVVMAGVYKGLVQRKRLKVLINPAGGQGRARTIFDEQVRPIFNAAQCTVDVQCTEYQNHALEIAKQLDITAYDCLVTVSGDGIIHEALNGFLLREDALEALQKVPLGVIPAGTGNALSICMLGEKAGFDPVQTALQIIKGKPMALDLCSVTYADKRYYSFLSHNYGMTAYADLATEPLRWMGDARTVLGLVKEIMARSTYPMEAHLDVVETDKQKIKASYKAARAAAANSSSAETSPDAAAEPCTLEHTLPALDTPTPESWTVVRDDVAFFLTSKVPWLARGMLSHPCALPNDGLLDLLLVRGNPSIGKQLDVFGKVEKGEHLDSSIVEYYKVKSFRLRPIQTKKKAYVAIDGEHAPAETFQVETHPRLARVLCVNDTYVDTCPK